METVNWCASTKYRGTVVATLGDSRLYVRQLKSGCKWLALPLAGAEPYARGRCGSMAEAQAEAEAAARAH